MTTQEESATRQPVLIVDDISENRSMFNVYFTAHDVPVVHANSMKEALELYKERKGNFRFVITDCSMETPRAGITLIKELQKQDSTLPICMFASVEPNIREEVEAMGVELLNKPMGGAELMEKVIELLKKHPERDHVKDEAEKHNIPAVMAFAPLPGSWTQRAEVTDRGTGAGTGLPGH